MADSVFTTDEQQQPIQHASLDPRTRRLLKGRGAYAAIFKGFADDHPERYGTHSGESGQSVVVPVVGARGQLLDGSGSPFGRIVVGHEIGSDEKNGGKVDITPLQKRIKPSKEQAPPAQQTQEAAAEETEADADFARVESELGELIGESPAPSEEDTSSQLSRTASLKDKLEQSQVRVMFRGDFGRASARFLAVEQHENQVVLVFDPESDIFVPASNGKAFAVEYEGTELLVQNVGIEFNLDFLQVGVLVFLISQ